MMAIRTAPTNLGATLTLAGILVTLGGIGGLGDWIYRSARSFAASAGPKFKVEYGYFMIPALDCPGGRCQQPQAQRLKVQSLDEQPIAISDVTVNERPDCILVNGSKNTTMSFGDVSYVISLCDPLRVRIVTDRGESTYHFE
jgi:hypothetical protein